MLVRPGKAFTLFKRIDDCCMKAALKCFGVENISIHQSMGTSLGDAPIFDRWLMHKEQRDKRADYSDHHKWSSKVDLKSLRAKSIASKTSSKRSSSRRSIAPV